MTFGQRVYKKERDCTNTGDKLQNVCRRYKVFESELCISVSVAHVASKREMQNNFLVH